MPKRMVLYGSVESHSSIQKAVELLGLGASALRLIQVDDDYRIDIDALESGVKADVDAGLHPFCVIGNVGTVNTGAVDDLERLVALSRRWNLWLHMDGAFGSMAWLCPEMRPLLKGLQQAHSLAFDLHKWMYLPYDVGCVLVRDVNEHQRAFSVNTPYLFFAPDGGCEATSFADYGIELTRRFRALKIWLALKAHGVRGFEQQIRENIRQARHLEALVRESSRLELAAPVSLNVVCFRLIQEGLGPEGLDLLNRQTVARVQSRGLAMPSLTVLENRAVIRVAITNHRSRTEDFDVLIDEVLSVGSEFCRALRAGTDVTHTR